MKDINTNLTNKNKFRIFIHNDHGKELEFLVKDVNFGGSSITVIQKPVRGIKQLKIPGSTIEHSDISIDFYINEDWTVYKNLYKWLMEIHDQQEIGEDNMPMKNMTIEALDSKFKVVQVINCIYCFPNAISAFSMTTEDDAEPLMGHVDFTCNGYIFS